MKFVQLTTLLIVAALLGGTYWYTTTAAICPAPIHYRVGQIDGDFNLTYSEAREIVIEAEQFWESRTERELFIYNEDSDFVIDFVFDERQELINEEESQREYLDERKEEGDKVREQVESLQVDYDELSLAYKERVQTYEDRLRAYNQEVNKYNDRGGAPPDVFEDLEREKGALSKEADELNNTAERLNDLAEEINRLADRGNKLVETYNREVREYNNQFGYEREFTQGDYQGNKINIYKFSSREELLTVLVHEYGHALGIDHVDEADSVMYYLLENTETEPNLSVSDIEAFYEVCGQNETFAQDLRRMIRDVLAKFK